MEESNSCTVQQAAHSLEEVAESQEELNCETIQHSANFLEEEAESEEELKRYRAKQLQVNWLNKA